MSLLFTSKKGWLFAKLAAVCCLVFACIVVMRMAQAAFLDYQVENMKVELNELKMKTVCVGRLLMDVPADAEVSYLGAMIAGWNIAMYDDETDQQFAARIKKKETELSGKKNEQGMRSLESVHQVDTNGVQGKIHIFEREGIQGLPTEKPSETVGIEAMVRAQQHISNLTREFGNDSYLDKLTELVGQFRARAENEIPTEAGPTVLTAVLSQNQSLPNSAKVLPCSSA